MGYLSSPRDTDVNQHDLEEAIQNVSDQLLNLVDLHSDEHRVQSTNPPTRSSTPRIPHPILPNEVNLNMVNDISTVVQQAYQAPHTNNAVTLSEDFQPRRRRNVPQPSNYKQFHNMGQF